MPGDPREQQARQSNTKSSRHRTEASILVSDYVTQILKPRLGGGPMTALDTIGLGSSKTFSLAIRDVRP